MMQTGKLLYEGKAKQIFSTEDHELVLVKYKDSATAFNGKKKADLVGKGELNNQISSILFSYLAEHGIPNHFIRRISATEQIVKRVTIIPLEVVVRNRVAGSMAKRFGLSEGEQLSQPVIEFYYKQDELGDPLMNEDHIAMLKLADQNQVEEMKRMALQVNQLLSQLFFKQQIDLVDFKLEFGLDHEQQLLLADEISPDTCRFWEQGTGRKLDKDRFRRDLGQVLEGYHEILKRLGGEKDVQSNHSGHP